MKPRTLLAALLLFCPLAYGEVPLPPKVAALEAEWTEITGEFDRLLGEQKIEKEKFEALQKENPFNPSLEEMAASIRQRSGKQLGPLLRRFRDLERAFDREIEAHPEYRKQVIDAYEGRLMELVFPVPWEKIAPSYSQRKILKDEILHHLKTSVLHRYIRVRWTPMLGPVKGES